MNAVSVALWDDKAALDALPSLRTGSGPRVLPSTVSRSLRRPTWSAGEQTVWHRVHTPGNYRWIVSVIDPLQASAHVARDFRVTNQFARPVTDRVDDHHRPEARSILSYAPAFRLEPTFPPCSFKSARGDTGLAILLGIKSGEMLPHDFLRRISFETLRARVPAADPTFRIKHVDRVVGDTLNEQFENAARPGPVCV